MQVKELGKMNVQTSEPIMVSDNELQNEYNYVLAETATKKLLENGFIEEGEYKKIIERHKEKFKPLSYRI